jgi:hypothetical protein
VGIGLALLDASVPDEVLVDVRGRRAAMEVVDAPFVDASPK